MGMKLTLGLEFDFIDAKISQCLASLSDGRISSELKRINTSSGLGGVTSVDHGDWMTQH